MRARTDGRRRSARTAFTLIELLVVVLILAILLAVSLPLYLSAVADSQRKTCRTNMQEIANAVFAAAVRNRSTDFSPYVDQDVTAAFAVASLPDLGGPPSCPAFVAARGNHGHGKAKGNSAAVSYTIVPAVSPNGPFAVECNSAPSHGFYEPGVTSQ